MFRHPKDPAVQPSEAQTDAARSSAPPVLGAPKEFTLSQVGELLEKNLKWSQIIYEQNRKINRKLFVSSLIGWIYFILIVGPIILAVIFLPSFLKNYLGQYQNLLGGAAGVKNQAGAVPSSLDQILKLLPLDGAGQEQLKALLK